MAARKMNSLPYWRLSGYYFFYFAFVGVFAPYLSLYLKSLQFASWEIAVLMSTTLIMRLCASNLWGWLADKTNQRVTLIRIAALLSIVVYVGIFFGHSFSWLLITLALMSFFWSAQLPLFEALTLNHLAQETHRYGKLRLWGSIGFIASVLIAGYVLDFIAIHNVLWMLLVCLIGISVASWLIPETSHVSTLHPQTLWTIIKRPEILALFATCFLISTAHGALNTFYSIYLTDHGYSKTVTGVMWSVGVIIEIIVFAYMPKLFQRYRIHIILLISAFCVVVRFLIIGWFVDWPSLLFFAQLLHGMTFGAHHAAAIAAIHQTFKGAHQVRGQALYMSISFGAGGIVGILLSGLTWDSLGPSLTFTLSSAIGVVAALLILWKVRL